MALMDPPPARPAFTPGIGHAGDHGAGVDRATRSTIGGVAKPTYAPVGGSMSGAAPAQRAPGPNARPAPAPIGGGGPDQPPSKVGPAPRPAPAPIGSGGPDDPPVKVRPGGRGLGGGGGIR